MKFPAAVFQLALALLLLHGGPASSQGFTGPKVADAKPGDLRIIATAAIREPLDAVLAQAQRVVGRPLVVEYGSARGNLKDEILAGQDFEIALLLPDVENAACDRLPFEARREHGCSSSGAFLCNQAKPVLGFAQAHISERSCPALIFSESQHPARAVD